MISYNQKRKGNRAPINLDDLDHPFYVLYQTPFHGVFLKQLPVTTEKEALEIIKRNDSTIKEHLIDMRSALGQLVASINDSRS